MRLDEKFQIDEQPERIISLAPSITESLYAAGAGELLVGRTDFCDYPPEVLELPSIGGFSSSEISVETIVGLEPDLVIGGSVYQADVMDVLADAGINGFILEPNSLAEIFDSIRLLGQVTGHGADAEETVAKMQADIQKVTDVVATIPADERVSVFYEVWSDPYMTTTDQTFIGELITLAGGRNIFGDLEEDYPTISSEEIVDRDPQVILGPSNHADQLTAEMIASREGWGSISAVKNGRVYIIDGNIISHAGPRLVGALEAIAAALYPDYFKE